MGPFVFLCFLTVCILSQQPTIRSTVHKKAQLSPGQTVIQGVTLNSCPGRIGCPTRDFSTTESPQPIRSNPLAPRSRCLTCRLTPTSLGTIPWWVTGFTMPHISGRLSVSRRTVVPVTVQAGLICACACCCWDPPQKLRRCFPNFVIDITLFSLFL